MSRRRQDPEGAECVWWDTLDLDALAAWCRNPPRSLHGHIRPADLQRRYGVTFNTACGALESLQASGVLERTPGPMIAYVLAPAPPQTGKGGVERVNQALRHLERLRDATKGQDAVKGWLDALTEDLMALLVDASTRASYSLPLSPAEHGALLRLLDDDLRMGPRGPDAAALRSLRSKLLRKEKP